MVKKKKKIGIVTWFQIYQNTVSSKTKPKKKFWFSFFSQHIHLYVWCESFCKLICCYVRIMSLNVSFAEYIGRNVWVKKVGKGRKSNDNREKKI